MTHEFREGSFLPPAPLGPEQTGSGAVIRPFQEGDVSAVTGLVVGEFSRVFGDLDIIANRQTDEITRTRVQGLVSLVSTVDEEVVGTVTLYDHTTFREYNALFPVLEGAGEIRQFAVDRRYKGLGIGRGLHEVAEDIARRNGLNTIALETASRARRLIGHYQGFGYEEAGRLRRPGANFESIFMAKPL